MTSIYVAGRFTRGEILVNFPLTMIALALVLLGCKRSDNPEIRKDLAGTWVATGGYSNSDTFQSTIRLDRNSNYVCQIVTQGASGMARTSNLEGNFRVKDGVLIDTMTKHSATNAILPMITRARIVRMDSREMVMDWGLQEGVGSATNVVVFRRVGN